MRHTFTPSILREYDIRGVVGRTLHPADAFALGRALGSIAIDRAARPEAVLACVGYDGRLSSPALEAELVRGLAACGLRVIRLGLGPSPMVYFAQKHLGADVAVVVTGSHNPPDHNGFKILLNGRPLFGEAIQALAPVAAKGDFANGAGVVEEQSVLDHYVARLAQDWDGGDARALTVVWDAGNGAAGHVLPHLTARLPGRHHLLFAEVDGRFPNHHPDPTDPATLTALIETVRAKKADLGLAFDGDGDRLGVVDARGRILWGDQYLQILAEDVLRANPGATVIADVKASQTLFDEIARLGGAPVMARTGHSLIRDEMARTGALLAGEVSGHIFFADRYEGFDDALYAAVRLLGIAARLDEPFAERVDRLPRAINSPELRYPCSDGRKFALVARVRDRLQREGATMSQIDGVRVRRAKGWWLLRASNTQPVLVARVEAATEADLAALQQELDAYLRQAEGEAGLPA